MKTWIIALRPKTLPAAICPVLLGVSMAYHDNRYNLLVAVATLIAAILIQIGTNFANDAFDYLSGADNKDRIGPMRVTSMGLLTTNEVIKAMWATFSLAILFGLYLAYIGGWPIIIIGLLSIISGIAYTGGPYPLGYNGLGDIFVFIFFGIIAVPGTYYLQTSIVSNASVLLGVISGAFSTCILIVNNIRDIETDKKTGKNTLAVKFGKFFCQIEYIIMLLVAFFIPIYLYIFMEYKFSILLVLFTVPIALKLIMQLHYESGSKLNAVLSKTARLYIIFAIILSFAIVV